MTTYNTQWLIDSTRKLLALGTENPDTRYPDDFICNALNWAYKRVLDHVMRNGVFRKYIPIGVDSIESDVWTALPDDLFRLVCFVDGNGLLVESDQVMTGQPLKRDAVLFRFNRDTLVWEYWFPSVLKNRLPTTVNPIYGSNLTMVYAPKIDELSADDLTHIPYLFIIAPGFEEMLLQSGAISYLWNSESCVDENNTKVQKFNSIFMDEMQRLSASINEIRYDRRTITPIGN